MLVNVFVSEASRDGALTQILVLPYEPEAVIPAHLQHIDWRFLSTTQADDEIICLPLGEAGVAIANDGYVVVTCKAAQSTLA